MIKEIKTAVYTNLNLNNLEDFQNFENFPSKSNIQNQNFPDQ